MQVIRLAPTHALHLGYTAQDDSSVAGDTQGGRGRLPRRENGRPPTAPASGRDLRGPMTD